MANCYENFNATLLALNKITNDFFLFKPFTLSCECQLIGCKSCSKFFKFLFD
jgi:hypothetical protein